MIKTESTRYIITPNDNRNPPDEVIKELKRLSSDLELFWNEHDNQWEFYLLKQKGITSDNDILCWQMSAPTKGTSITVGIVDWLRKYDTANGGLLSKEELKKNWLEQWAEGRENRKKEMKKQLDEVAYVRQNLIKDFGSQRTVVAIPKLMGIDERGKKIYGTKRHS